MNSKAINSIAKLSSKSKRECFTQPSLEILQCEQLSHAAYRLYNHLLSFCLKPGDYHCWPSTVTLAELMRSNRRSVGRWIAELEELGFITCETRAGNSNYYTLHNLRLTYLNGGYAHGTQESHVTQMSEGVRLLSPMNQINQNQINHERETGPGGVCLPENPDSPLGDIAQSSRSGYVALIDLGGFTEKEAERWSDYPNLAAWIELAKSKDSPASWLKTVFKNPASKLPKSRDSHQGAARPTKAPTTAPTTAPAPTEPEEEIEWLIPAPDCEITGCGQPVLMMHRCKLHLSKKFGGLADD